MLLGFQVAGRAAYTCIGNVRFAAIIFNFRSWLAWAGLLLLRLGTGIPLICFSIVTLAGTGPAQPARIVSDAIAGVGGIFLIFGLWTPVAGALVAITQMAVIFSQAFLKQSHPFSHIFLLVLGAALAMLGPGAWSIDARLFGRKRLIPPS